MSDSIIERSNKILTDIKDLNNCNEELSARVRQTVLEPFQVNPSQPEPAPTPMEFRQMATKLGPLALKIAKQSIKSIDTLQRSGTVSDKSVAAKCLTDCTLAALSSLRHMNGALPLQPYELEKITASLISRIVDFEEYSRALEELAKFRTILASVVKVSLTTHNSQSESAQSSDMDDSVRDTFNRYLDLFSFPMESDSVDHIINLLVLSYQMSALRCWCQVHNGALKKYLPAVMDKPGNYYNWCEYMYKQNPNEATKYLTWLQRLFSKVADDLVATDVLAAYDIQTFVLRISKLTNSDEKKRIMERMVSIGVQYEKQCEKAAQTPDYAHLQHYYLSYLKEAQPNTEDLAEMDFYFVLCDYAAYTSRKGNNNKGVICAYSHMSEVVQRLVKSNSANQFYYTAYAANALVALASAQLMKLLASDDSIFDASVVSASLKEAALYLQSVNEFLQSRQTYNHHTEHALYYLCQAIDTFNRSCKNLIKSAADRKGQTRNDSFKTPPRQGEIGSPSGSDEWSVLLNDAQKTLEHCGCILTSGITLANSKQATIKRGLTISQCFVELMILLSQMQMKISDSNTHKSAYDHLQKAENLCNDLSFQQGLNYLSVAYYSHGKLLCQANKHSEAISPLRKSIHLLLNDKNRSSTTNGRIQLCKRYNLYGACCQAAGRFEDAMKAYTLALTQVPEAALQSFARKFDTSSVSSIMKEESLLPTLLEKYLAIALHEPLQFASAYLPPADLTKVQKCILLECELKVCQKLPLRTDSLQHQLKLVDKLLKVYDKRTYPIRRARVLLEKVHLVRREATNVEESIKQALACATEARELLKSSERSAGDDVKLSRYRSFYFGAAYSWIVMNEIDIKGDINADSLKRCMRPWVGLLEDIHTILDCEQNTPNQIQKVLNKIDGVDQFYAHIGLLADFCGLHGQHVHQISALILLLKLNNGFRPMDKQTRSDSVIVASDIARLYCELGYTGKAKEVLEKIANLVEDEPCMAMAKIYFFLQYAQYHIVMDDIDNSIQMYNEAKAIWETEFPENSRTPPKSLKAFKAEKLLFAEVYYTISKYHSTFGKLDIAIEAATTSFRLLHTCMKGLAKSTGEQERNYLEVDSGNASTSTTGPDRTAKVLLQESQWAVAHKMSFCLQAMVNLYIRKGSWVEIECLVDELQTLANNTGSKSILFHCHLIASDFFLRYGDRYKSCERLELARQLQSKGTGNVEGLKRVHLIITEANLAIANEQYEQAINLNDKVRKVINSLLLAVYVAGLDSMTKGKSRILENQMEDYLDEQSSIPLQRLLNQNLSRTAMIHLKTGQVQKSLEISDKLIERYTNSSNVINNEFELAAIIAHAKLLQNQQKLSSAPHSRLFGGEASSLPAFKTEKQRLFKKRKTAPESDPASKILADDLEEVADEVVQALETGHKTERAALISTLSFEAGYATFMKSQIAKDDQIVGATKSCHYLSMSNAVSMRRDIEACLKVKTKKVANYRDTNIVKKWPSIVDDNDEGEEQLPASQFAAGSWLEKHLGDISNRYRDEYTMDAQQFKEEYIDILPQNWTVCSLTFDLENELLFAMQLRASEAPLIFKLPLNRAKTRPGFKSSFTPYNDSISELKDIIQKSDDTIFNSQNNDLSRPDVIAAWWSKRKELDRRLKDLLQNMEEHWFSGFKGLLSGRSQESHTDLVNFQKNLIKSSHSIVKQLLTPQKKIEYSLNFCRMVLRLGSQPALQALEDIAFFIFSTYEVPDELIVPKVLKELIGELKSLIDQYLSDCRKRGIDPTENIPGEHVILILDKHLQMLPIESMPILRRQPASRLPSLSLLRDRILFTQANNSKHAYSDFGVIKPTEWKDHTVSKKHAFYVLNPAGDLQETQKRMDPILTSVPEWKGITQRPPSEIECINALQSKDIYMYFGHGAGQSYIRGSMVKRLPKCSTSLLMGCSSGLLKSNGEFDPYGYVLNYLIAGSPAVVANLWDVTDRSIDRLTYYMLSAWGLTSDSTGKKSLVEAVSEGREHSTLTYLIGAASVVYGIPVYVRED